MEPFLQWLGTGAEFGQLWIRPEGGGYELRHIEDRRAPVESLKSLEINELRDLARTDAHGAFRPLKGAPDLRSGWKSLVARQFLAEAIGMLYPGALPDWLVVAGCGAAAATHFRDFVNRQTGMYRSAQSLEDTEAAEVIRACCGPTQCLKRRLWTVAGMSADDIDFKSVIPCLEPCAVTLEFFRRAARMKRETPMVLQLAPGDVESLEFLLAQAASQVRRQPGVRVGDAGAAENPRRILLALEHFQAQVNAWKSAQASKGAVSTVTDGGGSH